MKIYQEIALKNFQPWSGAKSVFYRLTIEELNTLEDILESDTAVYTDTDINDLFWFDDEWICETLGINTEEFWNRVPDYQIIALERAIKAGEECYSAFNDLAVITHVDFRFYGTDLYDALNVCKAWRNGLAKKEGE